MLRDPLIPEEHHGRRPSLTAKRSAAALYASWKEGEALVGAKHPTPVQAAIRGRCKALAAYLDSRYSGIDQVEALEWRRLLDSALVCGIKGWSNLESTAYGDGYKPAHIAPGHLYTLGSYGDVILMDAA